MSLPDKPTVADADLALLSAWGGSTEKYSSLQAAGGYGAGTLLGRNFASTAKNFENNQFLKWANYFDDAIDYLAAKKVYATDYGDGTKVWATLDDAITEIGSDNVELIIDSGTWAVTDDLIFPSNITLDFQNGAIFQISSSKTVIINNHKCTNNQQIFDCTGTGKVILQGYSSCKASWFGAQPVDPDNITVDSADSYNAITKALESLSSTSSIFLGLKKIVEINDGTYLTGTTIEYPSTNKDGLGIQGKGRNTTILRDHPNLGNNAILNIAGSPPVYDGEELITPAIYIDNVYLGGLSIRNGEAATTNPTTDKDGVLITYCDNVEFEDFNITEVQGFIGVRFAYVPNFKGRDIYGYKCAYSHIELGPECGDFYFGGMLHLDKVTTLTYGNAYLFNMGYNVVGEGGFTVERCVIENCIINDSPIWQGINSHGCKYFAILNGLITNCRTGINIVASQNFSETPEIGGIYLGNVKVVQGTALDSGQSAASGIVIGGTTASGLFIRAKKVVLDNVTIDGYGSESISGEAPLKLQVTGSVHIKNLRCDNWFQCCVFLNYANWDTVIDNLVAGDCAGGYTSTRISLIYAISMGNFVSFNNIKFAPESADSVIPKHLVYSNSRENLIDIGSFDIFKYDTGLFGPVLHVPYNMDSRQNILREGFLLKKNQFIYDSEGRPAWKCTSDGYTSYYGGDLMTVSGDSGQAEITVVADASSYYWTLKPGTNVTIVGAGSGGADLSAFIVENNRTSFTLSTNLLTTVTGAVLRYGRSAVIQNMPIRVTSNPTGGTFDNGDKIEYKTPAAGANIGSIYTVTGVVEALSGITGSIDAGSKNLTLNSTTNVYSGSTITVAGADTGRATLTARIEYVNTSTKVARLNTAAGATVTDAAVAHVNPTPKTYGAIAA